MNFTVYLFIKCAVLNVVFCAEYSFVCQKIDHRSEKVAADLAFVQHVALVHQSVTDLLIQTTH